MSAIIAEVEQILDGEWETAVSTEEGFVPWILNETGGNGNIGYT
ncbi:hypothetical protein SAMN05216276_108934 [Streptosporangium subroseum]|uniref:Uncharacterized protein n=1 Tax=Streptosporangium subroseum TaxID=106412 RepID=A0A239P6R3_9ACTN|nr:hypothetical protein [Streptosporangium subroseum]SNT62318.1 hypothetical protein SAMN05216276_108934 [Streptosporangium subroseum]